MPNEWTANWEDFDRGVSDKKGAKDLTDDEFVEYLRWLACHKPAKYSAIMVSFHEHYGLPLKVS